MPDVRQIERYVSQQFGAAVDNIERLRIGGNNKSWIATIGGDRYFVKQYFTSPEDPRDRLKNEFQFLGYAYSTASTWVAKPIAFSEVDRLAVYECLVGNSISADEVTIEHVSESARFFAAINDRDNIAKAQHLGLASEACFSISQHVDVVDTRLVKVEDSINATTDIGAKRVIKQISKEWQAERASIQQKLAKFGNQLNDSLPENDRCLSPSDFGFHNALITLEGIKFVDFEYAGWDDPAKMVGDFFSQLAVPVDPRYFDTFTELAFASFEEPERIISRARLLMVLYRFKWCCIALNVFIPSNLQRRMFANPDIDPEHLKNIQLQKATTIINELEKYRVLH